MGIPFTRRDFIKSSAIAGIGTIVAAHQSLHAEQPLPPAAFKPVVIASENGKAASEKAMEMILQGSDALDAVIAGVNIVEDDPNDITVGYGGLPNEEGIVELDASVMHGPTCRGGSVASLRNIKNPSLVARRVMDRSDHVLMVGEGALKFAKAHGFKEQDLLTDRSREIWLKWKENLSPLDDWLPPHDETTKDIGEDLRLYKRTYGTINCDAVDLKGNISGVTTTSGLAFKIPGRVGDSPILGAGLYVDNEVGAAGSTGRGEANLLSCASVMIVEWMRQGKTPTEACLLAAKRVVDHTKMRRLVNSSGKPTFNVIYYAIDKSGNFGSASIYGKRRFVVNTGEKESRFEESAYLYEKQVND
jgi:N4-(beta-N-acetylglucosaminyl)-L-asparaginase